MVVRECLWVALSYLEVVYKDTTGLWGWFLAGYVLCCVGYTSLSCFVLEGWFVDIGVWMALVFDTYCLFSCSEDPKITVITYDSWIEGMQFGLS